LAGLVKVFHPILVLFDRTAWLLGARGNVGKPKATLEEISSLAGLARLSNLIGTQEERIIREATHLSDTPVRGVMIPIDEVTFLSSSQTLMDAVLKAHLDPHTRFPVCGGNDRNDILGYANFKEMIYHMRFNPKDHSLNGIIRPVHFTSPDASSADLLRTFVEEHVHMAIVREGNKSVGLVTLEDIVEELVGEIEDEFDRVPARCHELTGGTWMVGGGFPTVELAKRLNVEIPEARGSVSSWLIHKMGRLPKANEVCVFGGIRFVTCRTRRGRIFELAVRREGETRPTGMFPPPGELIQD
jgi:putative hemolysin